MDNVEHMDGGGPKYARREMKNIAPNINLPHVGIMRKVCYYMFTPIPIDMQDAGRFFGEVHDLTMVTARCIGGVRQVDSEQLRSRHQ